MNSKSRFWPVFASVVFAFALTASACSKKEDSKGSNNKTPKPTTPRVDPAPAAAHRIADKMCACKDATCATTVRVEYMKWARDFGAANPDKKVMDLVNVASTRLGQCFKKLKIGASGSHAMEIPGEFKTPESVLYDAAADVYLVSNINGSPFAADGNGFISQVSPDGKVKNLKWIDGAKKDVELNGPKGMAILNGVLYVADITVVRKFDSKTGAAKGVIKVPGSTFLNDVAAGKDVVYVSDTGKKAGFKNSGTDAVWQIKGDKVSALIKDGKLGNPNGLAVAGKDVWVVNFGNAEMYKVTAGKKDAVVTLPKGGLDGLEFISDDEVLVSSWGGKAIYRGKVGGPFKALAENVEQPADIAWDSKRKRLIVPQFGKNLLLMYSVK